MTDHLPECFERELIGLDCICDRLRACEQRVEESMDRAWTNTLRIKQSEAFANGVQAARDAVAEAVANRGGYHSAAEFTDCALAAIDALKEKP